MNGVREYRDDDIQDRGFCPLCGRPLKNLTQEAKGYCEKHGWQFADWASDREKEEDE